MRPLATLKPMLPPGSLAGVLDHTLLAPGASPRAVEQLCAEAREHGFHAVCVQGVHVARCASLLVGSPVVVASVVGFPLGGQAPRVKEFEAACALEDGARELDVVVQLGHLLAGDERTVVNDLAGVTARAHAGGALVKAILETGLLTPTQLTRACELAREAGVDLVKTSTGFGPRGASIEDVRRMRAALGGRLGIKASGGIRTHEFACELLAAGATRLGTSASLAILRPTLPGERSAGT